jgi:hypothetical protein
VNVGEIERLRRAAPERMGPIRNLAELTRRAEAAGRARQAGAEGAEPAAQPVAEGPPLGVALGYRVIEEYLRQGRQAAEALGLRAADGPGGAGSFQTLSARLLSDGLTWLEYVAKLWTRLDPLGAALQPTASTGPIGSLRVFRVRVASAAPAEVCADLQPSAAGRALGTHPLRSPDPDANPIDGVELAWGEEGGGLCVSVRVREGQAPGLYSTIVFDRRDGSIQGTLSLRIAPGEAGR